MPPPPNARTHLNEVTILPSPVQIIIPQILPADYPQADTSFRYRPHQIPFSHFVQRLQIMMYSPYRTMLAGAPSPSIVHISQPQSANVLIHAHTVRFSHPRAHAATGGSSERSERSPDVAMGEQAPCRRTLDLERVFQEQPIHSMTRASCLVDTHTVVPTLHAKRLRAFRLHIHIPQVPHPFRSAH